MATLEQRLSKLETSRKWRRRESPDSAAMGRLMDALRDALPTDELEFKQVTPHCRELVFPLRPGWKRHEDKLRDLAERIRAGQPSEEDRAMLCGLPQDGFLGMSVDDCVVWLADVEASY